MRSTSSITASAPSVPSSSSALRRADTLGPPRCRQPLLRLVALRPLDSLLARGLRRRQCRLCRVALRRLFRCRRRVKCQRPLRQVERAPIRRQQAKHAQLCRPLSCLPWRPPFRRQPRCCWLASLGRAFVAPAATRHTGAFVARSQACRCHRYR
eukprot:6202531-Pleurochrysis_carterae.AAC.3